MPAASAARAITPSSASISRTRWPLPSPPIAGLQDISPIVAKRWVTRAVAAPMRAAAVAASQPAWPPPMTTTSNFIGVRLFHVKHVHLDALLANAEPGKDLAEQVFNPDPSDNAIHCRG